MSALLLPALMFMGCAGTFKSANDPASAKQKYDEAIQMASINKRPEMYASLKEAVQLNPLEPLYHQTLANAYFADDDLKNAETEYLQTIRLDENFAEAFKQLGRLYLHKGEPEKATTFLEKSLLKPKVTQPQQIHNWLAIGYYQRGEFPKAEAEWLKALRIRENENIRLNLALAYRDQEQFDKALDSLKKTVTLKPKFYLGHYHLALLYLKNKNLNQAARHFNRVIQLAPDSEQAKASLEYLTLIKPEP